MERNKSKHGKFDNNAKYKRARALKRFKNQNPDYVFVKLILPKQKTELARITGGETQPPIFSENKTYLIKWAEKKGSF